MSSTANYLSPDGIPEDNAEVEDDYIIDEDDFLGRNDDDQNEDDNE